MVHGTGTRPSVLSLALVSLSVMSCSEQPSPSTSARSESLALAAGEAGAAAPAAAECRTSDTTCNASDDDCDGRVDEDYPSRCVFGTIALVCRDGHVISEVCDDNDPCTVDRCDPQGCHHTPIACDDNNPCTADSCGANGQCVSTPVATGTACNDGNACTVSDACTDQAMCRGTLAVDPDDGNPCTADTCDAMFGVMHAPNPGASCNDGNACTANDACTATGSCAGMPRMDLDDGDPCTAEQCDPATGNVSHTPVALGTSCSDGDACNGVETCRLVETDFTIDARSSFYFVDPADAFQPPQTIKLSDIGVRPGMLLHFHTEGAYTSPMTTAASVIFSSDSELLAKDQLARVPGAIQSDAPAAVTGVTAVGRNPTDIPEDFIVGASETSVHVPEGAEYMFLGNWDDFFTDNTGSLRLIVKTDQVGCATGTAPVVDDDNTCTADACDPALGVVHEPIADGTSCESASGPGGCLAGECVAM